MIVVLRFLSAVLSVYMVILFLRVLLSWFRTSHLEMSGPYGFLCRITDPYLNFFRRKFPIQAGALDLSPLLAFIALVIPMRILSFIIARGSVSVGIVLALVVQAVWEGVGFVLHFFLLMLLIRAITMAFKANPYNPFIQTLDSLTSPLCRWIQNKVFKKKLLTHTKQVLYSFLILLVISLAGDFLVAYLINFLANLQF